MLGRDVGSSFVGAGLVPILRGQHLGTEEVVEGGQGVGKSPGVEALRGVVARCEV